ncbi:hypothetical protein CYMTET_9594 [Cymbomonas tetramitiformis]|uniref:AAA+ ATPase domain-containing protein n=1 Tax=Cymbomonas tetramitiformis TaxID=36881 RepID=A0AAE0GR05_9CHLO|nr:hypothetical protein CYMTET_9594 [Cymbomonas tetramitiformis]
MQDLASRVRQIESWLPLRRSATFSSSAPKAEQEHTVVGLPMESEPSWEELEFHLVARPELDECEHLRELLHIVPGLTKNTFSMLPVEIDLSIDQGYYMLVMAIQNLRESRARADNELPIVVGIGGPPGSGKSSLAHKVASVVGGMVLPMENYFDPSKLTEDNFESFLTVDSPLLVENLRGITGCKDISIPQFDRQKKQQCGFRALRAADSSIVLLEGTYALHPELRPYLDICVSVVGGVQFNLVKRVLRDMQRSGAGLPEGASEAAVLNTIFPMYQQQIEPTLRAAQLRITNQFNHLASLRDHALHDPLYVLRSRPGTCLDAAFRTHLERALSYVSTERFVDTHVRPMGSGDQRLQDWLRIRQCGGRYSITFRECIVEGEMLITPRVTFETGPQMLKGLLELGYEVALVTHRTSETYDDGHVSLSIDSVEELGETCVQVKSATREAACQVGSALGLSGTYVAKTTLQLCLEKAAHELGPEEAGFGAVQGEVGVSATQLAGSMASLKSSSSEASIEVANQEPGATVLTLVPLVSAAEGALAQTQKSVTEAPGDAAEVAAECSDAAAIAAAPHERCQSPALLPASNTTGGVRLQLAPVAQEVGYDTGLLMAVRRVQKLREIHALDSPGLPVVVGIGGPSGSGKSTFARKVAELMECTVVALDNYTDSNRVKNDVFDDPENLDWEALLTAVRQLRRGEDVELPLFDIQQRRHTGFQKVVQSDGAGPRVIVLEGTYALHPRLQGYLDLRVAVVGGVHFSLSKRVQRDVADGTGEQISMERIVDTIFPMFRRHIQPGLSTAHLHIRNDFDPLSALSCNPLYMLKSTRAPTPAAVAAALGLDGKESLGQASAQRDIFLSPPGSAEGDGESALEGGARDMVRVRQCGGRYMVLFRQTLHDGDLIVQPEVNFDVSRSTLAGLLCMGYCIRTVVESTARIFTSQQHKHLQVSLDTIDALSKTFVVLRSTDKRAVMNVASMLNLEGTFTTKTFIDLVNESSETLEHTEHAVGRALEGLQELLRTLPARVSRMRGRYEAAETAAVQTELAVMRSEMRVMRRYGCVVGLMAAATLVSQVFLLRRLSALQRLHTH